MTTEGTRRGLTVARLVTCLVVLAALVAMSALGGLLLGASPSLPRLLLGTFVVTVAMLLVVPVGFGGRNVTVDLAGSAIAFSLALMPGAWTVAVVVVVKTLNMCLSDRQLIKKAANVSTTIIAVGLATILVALLDAGGWPAPWQHWATLAAASLLYSLSSSALLSCVISCAMGERPSPHVSRTQFSMAAVEALLTLITLIEWRWARDLAVATPLLIVAGLSLTRRAASQVDEESALTRLAAACEPAHSMDPAVALAELAGRALRLFGAEIVEIDLLGWPSAAGHLRFARSPDGTATLDEHVDDGQRKWWMAAPLIMAGELMGELRLGQVSSLAARRADRQVMSAFQATVAGYIAHTRSRLIEAQNAREDPLTGLSNRLGLTEIGTSMLVSAALESETAAPELPSLIGFLLLDLDHFKEVNDTLGHAAGDQLLIEVGKRLRASCRTTDAVGRLGGDEFAVVLNGVRTPEEADLAAESMLKRITAPLIIDGLHVPVEGSIGVATSLDGATLDELRRCADIAMYVAKSNGRGAVAHYAPSQDTTSPERLELIAELQAGIVSQELVVHYQPKVELATGRIIGAEALVRWQHPTRGLLMPGLFVPAVERSALIIELTMAVLQVAITEAQVWSTSILPRGVEPSIAVNISRRCLVHRDFPGEVARLLATSGVRSDSLILELTEATELSELDVVEYVLAELRKLGVKLSVDDFGTGYSSMSFFQRVQVNEVKIEGQFVRAMDTDRASDAIVRSTVALGHGVGLPVVAEGIETQEQLEAVTAAGADIGQGYHLGRPAPASIFRSMLAENWALAG